MFCPKCGKNVENGVCSSCGFEVPANKQDNTVNTAAVYSAPATVVESNTSAMVFKIVFCILAIVVLVMFLIAANSVANGGEEIMLIKSVGGQTLEEAYYAELGVVYKGFATALRALGVSFASMLVWLGFKK